MLIGHAPEINRATVTTAEAGQCVSFALKRVRRAAVRKGMVLVNKSDIPPRGQSLRPGTFHARADLFQSAIRQFEGQVLIL